MVEYKEHIKNNYKMLFDKMSKDKDFLFQYFLNQIPNTISQARGLIRDIVFLSSGIVGLVIPLLLNSSTPLRKNYLIISAILFFVVILYGILLLVYVLKKELNGLPKAVGDMIEKMNKYLEMIAKVISEPTEQNALNVMKSLEQNHLEKKEEKWWKKYINHDSGFYGIFILAIIFLMISLFSNELLRFWHSF